MTRLIKLLFLLGVFGMVVGCQEATPTIDIEPQQTKYQEMASPESPESVRDAIVQYLFDRYGDDLPGLNADLVWEPLPELDVTTLKVYTYRADPWQISLSLLPAGLFEVQGVTLEEDTYDISLTYLSPPPYIHWLGLYSGSQGVTEDSYVNRSGKMETIPPDQVRDLAFDFMLSQHSEMEALLPDTWERVGEQVEVGEVVTLYQSGGWLVTVRWSEYTGLFSVVGTLEQMGEQYVHIEWNANLSADGSQIEETSYQYFGGE